MGGKGGGQTTQNQITVYIYEYILYMNIYLKKPKKNDNTPKSYPQPPNTPHPKKEKKERGRGDNNTRTHGYTPLPQNDTIDSMESFVHSTPKLQLLATGFAFLLLVKTSIECLDRMQSDPWNVGMLAQCRPWTERRNQSLLSRWWNSIQMTAKTGSLISHSAAELDNRTAACTPRWR